MTQSATREHDAATEHNAHAGHGTAASGPTRPQLAVVTILTLVTLAGAVILPAQRVNIGLSAQDVGGVVMPPGMIMTGDTPGGAMREMAAVLPEEASFTAAADAEGDQPLAPRLDDGVQVFDLETSVISWDILPGQTMHAYAFNRQVPGPRLRVVEGQRVRINVRNNLADPTSVHWHGLVLPNEMDGAAEVTQPPIEPGETFSYEFTAEDPGTFFYHSHYEPDRQQALGLYGALIIDPKDGPAYQYDHEVVIQLQEWLEREGLTYPAMSMEGGLPNFFTINGKSYPATQTIRMRVGEKLFVRFIGTHNNFVHPMHIHGGPFRIVETDGFPVPPGARLLKDTVNVGPGERYGVIWTAQRPGKWLLHCHIPHHTTNDNVEQDGGGGLMAVIEVSK